MPKIPRFRPDVSAHSIINLIAKTIFTSLNDGGPGAGRRFEDAFAAYIGVKNAVSVPSGRMGLYLILKNLGLTRPGEVILPAFTYWAVPRVVSSLKFNPVFADIDVQTCTIDPGQITKHLTGDSKVIVPTHLYGRPCRMDEILSLAAKRGLLVVEDCVQACGAEYQGRKVGSLGEAAYFAFGITKNLSLLGGGMVVTNNDALAEKIRLEAGSFGFVNRQQICRKAASALVLTALGHPGVFSSVSFPLIRASSFLGGDAAGRAFEEKEKQFDELPGSYSRLMPPVLQEDMGLRQLSRLDSLIGKRIKNAAYLLKNLQGLAGISLPAVSDGAVKNIFTNFPIRVKDRPRVAAGLLKKGIDTSLGYMKAQHAGYPGAQELQESILHLPVYPSLSEADLSRVCRALREIAREARS